MLTFSRDTSGDIPRNIVLPAIRDIFHPIKLIHKINCGNDPRALRK
jgi:hypothetical protein